MALTEEQKERMRKNKERALEIRKKKEEEARAKQQHSLAGPQHITHTHYNNANSRSTQHGAKGGKSAPSNKIEKEKHEQEMKDEGELEQFEIDASPFVTKHDAMKIYCLPAGTLEVCEFVEKDNPRNNKFSKMKLYHRNEIRRRARERFDGLDGLLEERLKRERKRFERDFEDVNDIFRSEPKKKKSGL